MTNLVGFKKRRRMKEKIKAKEDLQETIEDLKRKGKQIVFTNGCFDLVHIGHIRYLEEAKALGDILVVGINSDRSARLLKGRARPVVPQFARAELVAAVKGVDLCVIFDQRDPTELLRVVRTICSARSHRRPAACAVASSLASRA